MLNQEFKVFLPLDNDSLRLSIPASSEIRIRPALIWQIIKDLIGKDLSSFSLPVFFNEPTSVLQKAAEVVWLSASFGSMDV
jgi:hypothetical protein